MAATCKPLAELLLRRQPLAIAQLCEPLYYSGDSIERVSNRALKQRACFLRQCRWLGAQAGLRSLVLGLKSIGVKEPLPEGLQAALGTVRSLEVLYVEQGDLPRLNEHALITQPTLCHATDIWSRCERFYQRNWGLAQHLLPYLPPTLESLEVANDLYLQFGAAWSALPAGLTSLAWVGTNAALRGYSPASHTRLQRLVLQVPEGHAPPDLSRLPVLRELALRLPW